MVKRLRAAAQPLVLAVASSAALGVACQSSSQTAATTQPVAGQEQPSAATEPAAPDQTDAPSAPVYDAVPLVPREVLFGNPTKVSPSLSPDGKRMAYIAPHEGVLNIWVRTVGKADDKVVTSDKKRGIRSYFWAEDSKHLLYVQDKDGDENEHVFILPATGGEARDLTPIDGVKAQIISVERKVPNAILVGLNDRVPQLHDVYKIDLKSGKRKLVYKNEIGAIGFVADHRMKLRIAQVLKPDGGAALMHRKSDRAPWKELISWGGEDMFTTGPAGFAGNDRHLLMLSSVDANSVELRKLDTVTGKTETVAAEATADVSGLLQHPATYQLLAVAFQRAREEWKPLDKDVASDFKVLDGLTEGDFSVVSADTRNKTWLVGYTDDNRSPSYWVYDRKSKKGELLFSARPELDEYTLAEMKPVSYKARDGLEIHGYLTTPVGVEAVNLPTVIYPHGGPWYRDTWGWEPTAQWLANRGYAVLQPNFRGSTGYGKKFLNAADREWGGKMQDDITDGTKWLIDQGIADPKRICIMGGSYGGYATLMGLAKEPDLYACGVDIVGVANLITWLNTIPPYWKPFAHVLHQRVGHPVEDKAFLESRSPVNLVDQMRAPLLIAQGANDPRVPRDESIQIRDAFKKAGKSVQYVEFADEGHGFARPENRLEFFGMAEVFLADHLGGRSEK